MNQMAQELAKGRPLALYRKATALHTNKASFTLAYYSVYLYEGRVWPHRCSVHPHAGSPTHANWDAAAAWAQLLLQTWHPRGCTALNANCLRSGLSTRTGTDVRLGAAAVSQSTWMRLPARGCTEHPRIPGGGANTVPARVYANYARVNKAIISIFMFSVWYMRYALIIVLYSIVLVL